MSFSLGTFGTILSELQTSLRSSVPRSILYPFAVTVLFLAFVWGHVFGWGELEAFWTEQTEVEKLVVIGGGILSIFLFAYVLSALQGTVNRAFLGVWPPILSGLTHDRIQRHTQELRSLKQDEHMLANAYGRVERTLRRLDTYGQYPVPVVTVKRTISRFSLLDGNDVEYIARDHPPPGSIRDHQHAVGKMTTRAIQAGTPLTDDLLLTIPHPSLLQNRVIVPVSIQAHRLPIDLAPGTVVRFYRRTWLGTRSLSDEGWLVVAMVATSDAETSDSGPSFVQIMLAVPPTQVRRVAAADDDQRLVVVIDRTAWPAPPPAPDPNTHGAISIRNDEEARRREAAGSARVPHAFYPPGVNPEDTPALQVKDLSTTDWTCVVQNIDAVISTAEASNLTMGFGRSSESIARATFERSISVAELTVNMLEWHPDSASADHATLEECRSRFVSLLEYLADVLMYRFSSARNTLRMFYPDRPGATTATSIGNILVAVESYCFRLYGLDTALVLPRLRAVLSSEGLELLRATEERLELLQWSVLGIVFGGAIGIAMAVVGHSYWLALILWVAIPLAAVLTYRAAMGAAVGYANQLRLVFDSERGKVLEFVGLTVPASIDQRAEKALWAEVNQWWEGGTAPSAYSLGDRPTDAERS